MSSNPRVSDGKHIYAEAARLGLARALLAERRYAEAGDALHQAKARFVAEFGVDDWRSVDASAVEIEALARSGRRDEARQLLSAERDIVAASKRDTASQRRMLERAGKTLAE